MSAQPKPLRVDLHSQDPALLVTPTEDMPLRFIVVTDKGPRHLDLAALRAQLLDSPQLQDVLNRHQSEHFTRAQAEQLLSDYLTATVDSLKAALATQPIVVPPVDLTQAPVFVAPVTSVPSVTSTEPAHLADRRDLVLVDAQPQVDALAFVRELAVVIAQSDWRGHYRSPAPTAPVAPTLPANGSSFAAFSAWELEYAAYQKSVQHYGEALAQWERANALSRLKADGSLAAEQSQLVVLRDQLEQIAERYQVPLDLPSGQDSVTLDPATLVYPLVMAVQQLEQRLNSDGLIDQIASKVFERMQAARRARGATQS